MENRDQTRSVKTLDIWNINSGSGIKELTLLSRSYPVSAKSIQTLPMQRHQDTKTPKRIQDTLFILVQKSNHDEECPQL